MKLDRSKLAPIGGEQMRAPMQPHNLQAPEHLTFVRYKYDLERCRGELKGYEISLAKRHIENALRPQPLHRAWQTTLTEAVKNYKARIAELEKIDEEKQAAQDRSKTSQPAPPCE